ncbi:MAG: CHAT domain-containing protein, partial [Nocardioidaceae bacterium]|nr:CHAT domain-containing protein [Nocardioidaceae bacterium]
GERDVTAFVVRDGQVDARRLPGAVVQSRRLVSSLRQECILIGAATVQQGRAGSAALDALYETLVEPVADLLSDLDEELRVIGHLHLHAVPFDALLDTGAPWHDQLGGGLAETDDSAQQDAEWRTPPTTLVLAVPDAAAPSIRAEAEMVFTTLPDAHVLVGGAATREALRRYAGHVDLVHLACHGIFHATNPLRSALQLGDGWMTAQDILDEDLGLQGAAVVLSACSAGRGAEEVPDPLGLTWACLAAGAHSVIAALWQVDDQVTAQLMSSFYSDLVRGIKPEQALARARRVVARDYPHPYFWAGFRCFTSPDERAHAWGRRRRELRGLPDAG